MLSFNGPLQGFKEELTDSQTECERLKTENQTLMSRQVREHLHLHELIKGKALRKHSLHGKIAAVVLLKLFISGNERCHTTEAPL